MKKYKLIIQIEQIKKYLEQGQLQEAYELAEKVDIKRLKSMSDLSVIAECYFQNKRYVESKEMFEQIYDTVKTRRILAQLVHLSIKLKDIIEANYYLDEFIKIAPKDFYQYIFRYSIDKLMRKPIEVLIADLEKLREVEYIECWAYELAKLYYKIGDEAACRKECEKIILWFGSGEYVDRAKALLAIYNGELDLEKLLNSTKQDNSEVKEKDPQDFDNQMEYINEEEELKDQCAEDISYQLDEKEDMSNDSLFKGSEVDCPSDDKVREKEGKEQEDLEEDLEEEFDVEEDLQEEQTQDLILQEESKVEEDLQEESTKNESIHDNKVQEGKEQSTIIIPPGFGKSKHTLFHNKYGISDNQIEIDADTNENKDIKEVIVDDNRKQKEDLKSLVHIDFQSNDKLIHNSHSKLLPLLEEKKISLSEIFGNFLRIDGLRDELLHSLEQMIHSAYDHQNLIIMGSEDSGKTLLAKRYAKLLHRLSFISSPKVALIDANKLNRMDFIAKSHQLKDCIMILQNAQYLSRDTLIRLMELQQIPDQNIIYILLGLKEEMEQLWEDKEELSISYPNRIALPLYELEDYLGFAYDTIFEAGYKVEKEAFDYLKDVILDKIKVKRENTLSEVFSYLNQVIENHEKQNEQVLLELTRKGNLDQFNLSVIKIEDMK